MMNADLQKLIELEKLSQEIARLNDEVAALPKRVAEIESKLANAKSQVEAATAAIKKQEADKRKHESDIQDWQQKIVKFREQSNSVKTNEQYKALMHEIEFAEKQIGISEEQILIGMESAEELKKALAEAEAELKADQVEVEKEKEHARSLTAEDQQKLAELEAQKKALRGGVEERMLAHYDRVALKRKGAIAAAVNQKCAACNVMMRPQRYNELLSAKELITCDSCGRILYYDPNLQTQSAAVKKLGPERAWYYLPSGNGAGRFVAVANAKSGCTFVSYDAGTGQVLERQAKKKITYQETFPEVIANGQSLRSTHAAGDEEYLDPEVLEELQLQAHIAPGASA